MSFESFPKKRLWYQRKHRNWTKCSLQPKKIDRKNQFDLVFWSFTSANVFRFNNIAFTILALNASNRTVNRLECT